MSAISIANSEAVNGETIIAEYLNGDKNAEYTYHKICHALDLIGGWESRCIVEFLENFLNVGYLLDHRCSLLVQKFARLEWQTLPEQIRQEYVQLLLDISMHHVCHTDVIVKCFVEHLLAKIQPVTASFTGNNMGQQKAEYQLLVSSEEQNQIFSLALDAIRNTLNAFPMLLRRFVGITRQCYPHYSVAEIRYISYVKNLMRIMDFIPNVRSDVLSVLIDGLVQLDAMLSTDLETSALANYNSNKTLFAMEEDSVKCVQEDCSKSNLAKILDECMCYLYAYTAKLHNREVPSEIAECVDWISPFDDREGFFDELLTAFEEHLLMTYNMKNITFLWFYLCSLEEVYQDCFLAWLWSFVTRLSQTPNDWKKAQGAVCCIGSLISRADYIDLRKAMYWMETLSSWCTKYVNAMICRTNYIAVGTAWHGTFYSTVQALLTAFCFRYSEIIRNGRLQDVHLWGFGHLLHSILEPLAYISYPVASCFASISRSLQLVYCSHILPASISEEKAPFQSCFPFDAYCLKRSSLFISSLVRRFSPLNESANVSTKESDSQKNIRVIDSITSSLEFIEETERESQRYRASAAEGTGCSPTTADFLTVYSTSPGLMEFNNKIIH